MTSPPALLATRDDDLLDDVLRLAAAAGSPLDVAHDPDAALRGWTSAPLVLVGADAAAALGARRPPRRPGVHVVGTAPLGDAVFRDALAVGACEVLELPAADGWLVEVLADSAEGVRTAAAPILGVTAGSGGAGASTFAAAVAQVAGRTRSAVLVDLDPWGAGLDRLVGIEDVPGTRWESLAEGNGRLGSRSLTASLPARERLAVLSWGQADAEAGVAPPPSVVSEVLSAAQRGSELVVVDLPRPVAGAAADVAARCDEVVVVCEATLTSVLAARRTVARLRSLSSTLVAAVRDDGGHVPAEQVADSLGLPLVAAYPSRRRVVEQVELGLGPVVSSRAPMARAARDVLARPALLGRASL